MRILSLSTLLIALALTTQAGFCGPDPGPDPCEDDKVGCEEAQPGDWQTISCDVDEPLEVDVGRGESSFEPITQSAQPVVHFGAQGGQHTFLGIRVYNARLDLYQKLRVTFWIGQGASCVVPDAESGALPEGCSELTRRQVILGGRVPLATNESGDVEELPLLVFLRMTPDTVPTLVAATIEDPCGRTATATATYTPSSP